MAAPPAIVWVKCHFQLAGKLGGLSPPSVVTPPELLLGARPCARRRERGWCLLLARITKPHNHQPPSSSFYQPQLSSAADLERSRGEDTWSEVLSPRATDGERGAVGRCPIRCSASCVPSGSERMRRRHEARANLVETPRPLAV